MSGGSVRVFELAGIDGVGKTTQAELLVDGLRGTGWRSNVLPPRQLTEGVKQAWLNYHRTGDAGISYESLAIAGAAALMFQQDEMRRSIQHGEILVADRYVLSALAYNSMRGSDMAFVRSCYSKVLSPEGGVLLCMDPAVAACRLVCRSRPLDFEERNLEWQVTLQNTFLSMVPDSWLVLDATGDRRMLAEEILAYVHRRLG